MSNVVIAPDVGWAFGLAEVDKGTVLELSVAVAALPVLMLVLMPVLLPAALLVTTGNTMDIEDVELEVEVSKDGAAIAVEGSTSLPIPQ